MKTPMQEVKEIDRVIIPTSQVGWDLFVRGYRFPYWKTAHENRYFDLVFLGLVEGQHSWALMDGDYIRYNKRTYRWESGDRRWEPACRMTLDEARKLVPRVIYYENHHARRKMARIIRVHRWREDQRGAHKAAMTEVATTFAQYLKAREGAA